jgi:hypothetical protein
MIGIWTSVLAEAAPTRMGLAAWAALPTLIGLGLYWMLSKRDPAEAAYKLRFMGIIPMVAGLVMGVMLIRQISDFVYQQAYLVGPGMKILHYAVGVVPILGILGLFGLDVAGKRQPKYDF